MLTSRLFSIVWPVLTILLAYVQIGKSQSIRSQPKFDKAAFSEIQHQLNKLADQRSIGTQHSDSAVVMRLSAEIEALQTELYRRQRLARVGREGVVTNQTVPNEYLTQMVRGLRVAKSLMKLVPRKYRPFIEREFLPVGNMLLSLGMNEEAKRVAKGMRSIGFKYLYALALKRQGKLNESIAAMAALQKEVALRSDSLSGRLGIEIGEIHEEQGELEKAEKVWLSIWNNSQLREVNSPLIRLAAGKLGLLYYQMGAALKAQIFLQHSTNPALYQISLIDFIDNDLSLLDNERESITPYKLTTTMMGASLGIVNWRLKPYVEDSLRRFRGFSDKLMDESKGFDSPTLADYFDQEYKRQEHRIVQHNAFITNAMSLFTLGNIAYGLGKYSVALEQYRQAAIGFERLWGAFNIYYWMSLNNIAQIEFKQGNYNEGNYFREIVSRNLTLMYPQVDLSVTPMSAIFEEIRATFDIHRRLATDLNVYYDFQAFALEQDLQQEQPNVYASEKARNEIALADLYRALKQYETAAGLYRRALLFDGLDAKSQLIATLGIANIKRQIHQSDAETWYTDALNKAYKLNELSLINQVKLQTGLFYTVQDKSVLAVKYLNEVSSGLRTLQTSYGTSLSQDLFNYLTLSIENTVLQLNGAYKALLPKTPGLIEEIFINSCWQKMTLSQRSKFPRINYKEIQQKLSKNSWFADYSRYIDPDSESVQYGLFLLDKHKLPSFRTIGSELDLINTLSSKSLYEHTDAFSQLVGIPSETPTEVRTLYISPSGLLHKVSFIALQEKNVPTIDQYSITYLNSAARLLEPAPTIDWTTASVALWGGINYDSASTSSTQFSVWQKLKGSTHEIELIRQLMAGKVASVSVISEEQANEKRFHDYNNQSPNILHVATHGYFFPEDDALRETSNTIFQTSDNPLHRSGLILWKGNEHWIRTDNPDDETDGVLTAQEVGKLNLSNTKLAVLSACETALGVIEGNLGVFGLQRAFQMAGVDYLVVSQWPIDDKDTVNLMQFFYQNLLNKQSISDAFGAAQRSFKSKHRSSKAWASFVLIR